MATETQQAPPEITIINRLGSIPLVADSLTTIHTALSSNTLTSYPYASAQAISKTALGYSAPIQRGLAPLLVRADGVANAAVDAVESRYPYPFKTPTDDIVRDLKDRSDAAKGVASKTLDERVASPTYSIVAGIDQRFTPLVDLMENCVNQFAPAASDQQPAAGPSSSNASSSDANQLQLQRALGLPFLLRDNLYALTTEQYRQLQSQSALVRNATDTAESLSTAASAQYAAAHGKVASLSDTMLAELKSIRESTAQLPAHLQASFQAITTELSSTIHDLTAILSSKDIPPREKVNRVTATVQERVQPLLDATTTRISALLARKSHDDKAAHAQPYDSDARHANASLAAHRDDDAPVAPIDVPNPAEQTGVSYADKLKQSGTANDSALVGDEQQYPGFANGDANGNVVTVM